MAKITACDRCFQPIRNTGSPEAIRDLPLVADHPPMDFCSQVCLRGFLHDGGPLLAPALPVSTQPASQPPPPAPAPMPVTPAEPPPPNPNMPLILFEGGPLNGQSAALIRPPKEATTINVRVELEFDGGAINDTREVTYNLAFGSNTATWPEPNEDITPEEWKRLTGTPKIV